MEADAYSARYNVLQMLLPYEFLWLILRQIQGTCSLMLPELQLYLETCQTIYTCLTNVNTNPEILKKKKSILK